MFLLGFIGNLSGMDGIILLLIVLVLFGAKRLPELARSMGLAINEFNKAKTDVQRQLSESAAPPAAAPQVPPTAVNPQPVPPPAPLQPPASPSEPEKKA